MPSSRTRAPYETPIDEFDLEEPVQHGLTQRPSPRLQPEKKKNRDCVIREGIDDYYLIEDKLTEDKQQWSSSQSTSEPQQ